MPTAKQVRQIIIKAQVAGSKEFERLAKQIGTINKSTNNLSRGFNQLRGVFAAGIFGVGLREIAQALDSFSLLEDRIKVFTGDAESASQVFDKLGDAARFTATSVDSLAQSYNRVALATTELGLSQDEILATTALLQQTFRISGATIAEATSSTIQLAQGLSSGQLRGQELRSVLEQNAVFANLLSKELEITRGQLIKFAESGQITSDRVLKALFNNFEQINEQAGNLSLTIGQVTTIALDRARFALRDINKEFGVTEKVVKGILFVADNLKTVLTGLGAAFAALVTPKAIQLIGGVLAILLTIEGAVAVIGGAIIIAAATWETSGLRIQIALTKVQVGIEKLKLTFNDLVTGITKDFNFLFGSDFNFGEIFDAKDAKKNIDLLKKGIVNLNKELEKNSKNNKKPESFGKFLKDIAKNFNTSNKLTGQATGQFAQLNAQFGKGTGNLQKYQAALEALQLDQLNARFAQGEINLIQYTEQWAKLNTEVDKLGASDQILKGFQLALNDTFNGLGTLLSNVRSATNAVFGELEDQILNFVKTGKFAFKDFTQFVLDELTKIVIRLSIIKPLAGSLGGLFSTAGGVTAGTTPSGAPVPVVEQALGGVWKNGNVTAFASGGVVNSPVNFPMSDGRVGLMGEAGPEAIIPLERGPGGKLGVNASGTSGVVVNINNYTDNQVEVNESRGDNGERQLDLVITRGVNRAIGNGSLDRALSSNFGLNRRGS
jgi:lambda family phage tail tape measure protein